MRDSMDSARKKIRKLKESFKRVKFSKTQIAAIIVLFVICVLIVIRIVNGPFIKPVKDFSVMQNNKAIDVSWTSTKDAKDTILFFDDGKKIPRTIKAGGTKKTIPVRKVPGDYKVAVISFHGFGLPKYSSQKIHLEKVMQNIEVKKWDKAVIVGGFLKVNAKALGKMKYHSSDPSIIKVTDEGEVKYRKPGIAHLVISAKGGDYYNPAVRKFQVRVYPTSLQTTTMSAKAQGANAKLSWKSVKYADKYIIYKYDAAKETYEKYKTLAADKRACSVLNQSSTYKVRAVAKLAGKNITGALSESQEIESPARSAEEYKDIHLIKTIRESDLEKVADVKAQGNIVVPQSFCRVGSNYVVALVSRLGVDGALLTFSEKGKLLSTKVADMGYANGSTYNSRTGKIYTVRAHKGTASKLCTSFDVDNDMKRDTFEFNGSVSGIAYDEVTGKYCLSSKDKVRIVGRNIEKKDKKAKAERVIEKIRYKEAQDIGAHDGVVLVTVWEGEKNSHVDMYKESDGAYIGSYDIPIGEIESVTVVDKHLVLLMHNTTFKGKTGGFILKTKEALALP